MGPAELEGGSLAQSSSAGLNCGRAGLADVCLFVCMYEHRVGDCSSVDSQWDQCYANLLVRDCSASSTALFDPPSGSNSLMSSHFCWVSSNVVCQQQRLSALPVLTVLSWHWIAQPATTWLQLAATYDLFSGDEKLICCISCMTLELTMNITGNVNMNVK